MVRALYFTSPKLAGWVTTYRYNHVLILELRTNASKVVVVGLSCDSRVSPVSPVFRVSLSVKSTPYSSTLFSVVRFMGPGPMAVALVRFRLGHVDLRIS